MAGLVVRTQRPVVLPPILVVYISEFLWSISSTTTPSFFHKLLIDIMPTHYLKITTPMVCGGCTGTVEKALLAVPGVSGVSVSLDSKAAQVHTTDNEIACKCKVCNCDTCQCMAKSLVAATAAAGFDSTIATAADFSCGSDTKLGHCGSPNCTCGDNCQCGSQCQCAGCPGSACGSGASTSCGKLGCTCTSCTCGAGCSCTSCQSGLLQYVTPTNVAVGAALVGIGWMAAIKFAK